MPRDLETEIARRFDASPEDVSSVMDDVVGRIRRQVSSSGYARVGGLGTFRGEGGHILFEPDPELAAHVNLKFIGLKEVIVPAGSGDGDGVRLDERGAAAAAPGQGADMDAEGEADMDPEREAHIDPELDAGIGPEREGDIAPDDAVRDLTADDQAGGHDADLERPKIQWRPIKLRPESSGLDHEASVTPPGASAGHDDDEVTDRDAESASEGDLEDRLSREGHHETEHDYKSSADRALERDIDSSDDSDLDPDSEAVDDVDRKPGSEVSDDVESEPEPVTSFLLDREERPVEAGESEMAPGESEMEPEEVEGAGLAAASHGALEDVPDSGSGPHESLRGHSSDRHSPVRGTATRTDRSRGPIWMGAGVIVLAAAAAVIFFMLMGGEPEQPLSTEQAQPQALADTSNETAGADTAAVEGPVAAAPEEPLEAPPDEPVEVPDDDSTPLRSSQGIDLAEGGYTIIVYSESSQQNAETVAAQYRDDGFRADVLQYDEDDATQLRVGIGQFTTLTEAAETRNSLAGNELPEDAWVRRLP